MFSIITGAILLGFVHALIPNHWLPVVAIAKSECWSKNQVILVTLVSAFAHVLGTVLLGIVLGMVGIGLAHQYEDYIHIIAPVLLILFGLVYFTMNPSHHHTIKDEGGGNKRRIRKWIMLFIVLMFLSPCLEVESLFLAAGAYGWNNIIWLGFVYAAISIGGITGMVMLAFKGVQLLDSDIIEHNEKRITGTVLIAVGIITFFLH